MSLNTTLSAPFYEGSPVTTTETPWPLQVALNGRPYLIDLNLYQRRTIPQLREASDQSAEPGEQTLNPAGIWKRNAFDWTHGAGQKFWDGEEADRRRFESSKGVNPWESRQLTLLPETTIQFPSTETNLEVLEVSGYLYVASGRHLNWSTNPLLGTWSDAGVNTGAAIESITTNGTDVFAAINTTGVWRTTAGATLASLFSSYAATLIAYVNGWLLAANGNELVQIGANGSVIGAPLKTHDNPNFQWTAIASSPSFIYAAGHAGGTTEIYRIGLRDEDASLALPVFCGGLADGESLLSMRYYGGAMVIGTNKGVRLAIVGDDGGLSAGKRVNTSRPVLALEAYDQFAWFGMTDYDAVSTGIGRVDLTTFVDTLTPAWASDLMAGDESAPMQGQVTSIATFDGRRYFTVAGSGLYGESDCLVTSGSITSGWINYSTFEQKVIAGVDLRHGPLSGSITVDVETESGTRMRLGSSTTGGTHGPTIPISGRDLPGEMVKLILTFTRDAIDCAAGPVLFRWSLRAHLAPMTAEEFLIPIMLNQVVDEPIGGGRDRAIDPLAEYEFLKGLERSRRTVVYQEGTKSYRGTVRGVGLEKPDAWTSDRTFFQGTAQVRFVSDPSAIAIGS